MNWIKNISVVLITTVISIKCADLLLGYLAPHSAFGISERGERSLNLREINPNYNAVLWPSDEYNKTTVRLKEKVIVRTDNLDLLKMVMK